MSVFDSISTTIQPIILEAASLFVLAGITYVANVIRQKTGLEIEARHREALHTAIMTGAAAAVRNGPTAGKEAIMREALEYARQSVPDAIKKLKPSDAVLTKIADRYSGDAIDWVEKRLQQ